jgi:hypothetical protein
MTDKIPTQVGDVLILKTDKAGSTYAVGSIKRDGQQDFKGEMIGESQQRVKGYEKAKTTAKAMVMPGRVIYIRADDTGQWEELS